MSLLNRPSDGIYPVLIAIFQLLLNRKSLSKEQLLRLCAPPEACSQDHANNTLNTWSTLGLFDVKSDGTVTIHADVVGSDRKPENLRKIARRLVLDPRNNADLWAKEESRSADFTLGLSWFLAQDSWTTELGGWNQAEDLSLRQMPSGKAVFQNDTRWSGFKDWASYLGFGCNPRFAAGITPDPTEAIRDSLPAIFGKKKSFPAKDFIRHLAEVLPVLDDGEYRRQVEALLRSQDGQHAWKVLPEGQLSTSLSRALIRLHEEGVLRYSLKADSVHRMKLTGRGGSQVLGDISDFSYQR
ncbi:MAG: hypothetical protein KDN05_00275 [Verrucomicrobiae bacterium]|nr:hypothetical protein [Verrucomicrobiae bacterium]